MASLRLIGLSSLVDEGGCWAALIQPAAPQGVPRAPWMPFSGSEPWLCRSWQRGAISWLESGAEGSQDLSPGALGTAVQDEVSAGTGRNSRLSLGLVLLWLVFLNCG